MHEQRRVRFGSIEGLGREDLAIAGEVWLEDLSRAAWVTREAMKLATHFVRYMRRADPTCMILREIECEYQLSREEVLQALKQMQAYGAVEAFACDRADLRVSLHLSYLQRLRVLEAIARFGTLLGQRGRNPRPWHAVGAAAWQPKPPTAEPDRNAPAAAVDGWEQLLRAAE